MKEALTIILVIVAGFCLLIFSIISIGNRLAFPGELAEIEQLRSDAANADIAESEDVVGQVAAVNRSIASAKAYNKIPILELAIPDAWDGVQPIKIAGRR